MQRGDHRFLKSINQRLVLNLVRLKGVVSSSDLVYGTGLQPSTVSNILKELSSKHLVTNLGKGSSTDKGGKRPYLWSLNKEAVYAIGIDIEIGQITAVILGFNADIVRKKVYQIADFGTLDGLVAEVTRVIDDVLSESGLDLGKILGIGIAVAGIVNSDSGVIVMTDILPEINVPLLDALSEKLAFPIFIENNANASVVGDKWIGVAKEGRNCLNVLVEVGEGVGALGIGFLVNEELYHGSSFSAGEINPSMPDLHDMLINVRTHLRDGSVLKDFDSAPQKIGIDQLIEAAKMGDKIAESFFDRLGYQIGRNISRIVAALNPDLLILSGDVAEVGELIIRPVRQVLDMEFLAVTREAVRVVTSSQGHYSVAIGAASLVLSDYFKVPSVQLMDGHADSGKGVRRAATGHTSVDRLRMRPDGRSIEEQ